MLELKTCVMEWKQIERSLESSSAKLINGPPARMIEVFSMAFYGFAVPARCAKTFQVVIHLIKRAIGLWKGIQAKFWVIR